jgi:hypothetical protein
MKFSKWFNISLIFLIYSCSQGKSTIEEGSDIKISLSADSTELILSNIPSYVLDEFREDSLDNNLWTNFFAVYKDTSDLEMRDYQPALEGTYAITDSSITFKPKLAWSTDNFYFARCYTKTLLRKPEDIISQRTINPSGDFIEFKFSALK